MRFLYQVRLILIVALFCSVCQECVADTDTTTKKNSATDKPIAGKTFTIQYRGPGDAFAPSNFIVITEKGPLLNVVHLKWTLPELTGKRAKKQARKKKAFDSLIAKIEKANVSAQFECIAAWEKPRPSISDILVMSVPQLTEKSKEDLQRAGVLPSAAKAKQGKQK